MNQKIKKMILITIVVIIGVISLLYILGTNEIKTRSELIINKDIQTVWEVMGNQFPDVHRWSSNFTASKSGGAPKLANLDYLYRETITERGVTVQEVDVFNPDNYSVKYHITKGAPAIAKMASGHWYLERITDEKTNVVIEFFLETEGIKARMLSPLIKKKIGANGAEIAKELKYYIENGKAHPNKANK